MLAELLVGLFSGGAIVCGLDYWVYRNRDNLQADAAKAAAVVQSVSDTAHEAAAKVEAVAQGAAEAAKYVAGSAEKLAGGSNG